MMNLVTTCFLPLLIFNTFQAIRVGYIENAILVAPNTSRTLIYGTCNECLCIMLNSNQSIVSLNCYKTNKTCYLFFNYSQSFIYQMENKSETIFYSLVLPEESDTNLYWPFDGNINELDNRIDVTSNGNMPFVSPGIYGRGSAIYFNGSKYLNATSSKLKLAGNSFTFEIWIYPMSMKSSGTNCGVFGQCQMRNENYCLHIELRSAKPYFGFYLNDCPGITNLTNNTWYHLAVVYDAVLQTQTIFLNGNVDCNRTAGALKIAENIPLTIGIDLFIGNGKFNYFHGYMDQLSYVSRAKSTKEIYNDAILIAYFPFNQSSLVDFGPNQMTGTGYQLIFINDSLLFNETLSSFQIETFESSSSSSSIAFWINPFSTNNSLIIHILFNNNNNTNIIKFDDQNHLISQIYTNETISIIGPVINTHVWIHIVQTYSITNGFNHYLNGTFINGTGSIISMNTKQSQTITLDNCSYICTWDLTNNSRYVGLIDEFRIYSKELNLTDIQSLIYR